MPTLKIFQAPLSIKGGRGNCVAVTGFNLESDLEQKTTKMERNVSIVHFQNLQTCKQFHNMVACSVGVVKMGLHHERAILPVLPQNIASKPKPKKEEIILKQKTQLNKM